MTHHVPAELQNYVRQSIIPQYANFDKAHQIDHVEKVIEESLKLATHYEVDYSMVYVIAAYHDLGLYEGREFHHITSGKVLLADETLRRWFTDEQLLQMKEAIEDHRASSKQAPRTIYGMIVAEADRIIDPEVTLRRTVQYGLSHYPEMDKEEQYARFRKHLTEKYAEGGYLKLWIPQSDNAGRLAELRNLITNEDELRQVQQLCKRELLLGLAQARSIFPLIIDHTAQISLQLQLAGLQPLLQHHRPDKALDQLEHRWQIIRDQDLCFQRQLCLEGTVCPRRRQGIPKDLQLHGTRSFPVRSWCHFIPGTGRIERSYFPETQKAAAQRFHCAAALSQSGFGENQVLIQQPWQPRSA